jgi:hypothetical protein
LAPSIPKFFRQGRRVVADDFLIVGEKLVGGGDAAATGETKEGDLFGPPSFLDRQIYYD